MMVVNSTHQTAGDDGRLKRPKARFAAALRLDVRRRKLRASKSRPPLSRSLLQRGASSSGRAGCCSAHKLQRTTVSNEVTLWGWMSGGRGGEREREEEGLLCQRRCRSRSAARLRSIPASRTPSFPTCKQILMPAALSIRFVTETRAHQARTGRCKKEEGAPRRQERGSRPSSSSPTPSYGVSEAT